MTFSSRRKRPTILRAAPARLTRTITSTIFLSIFFASSAAAQDRDTITPRFVPARPNGVVQAGYVKGPAPAKVVQVAAQAQAQRGPAEEVDDFVQIELPGPQGLFRRETEEQFFERIKARMKKQSDGGRVIFPEQTPISKEPYRPRAFPAMVAQVEPCYVCYGRTFFDQPNFERLGYDFGILTTPICVGAFYYDTIMFPYHAWSNLRMRYDCSTGQCLPGDQAPFTIPRERFSVTGLVGQSGTMIGLGFLFP